jgi:hypothetical protein
MRFLAFFVGLLSTPVNGQDLTLFEANVLPRLIQSMCVDIHPSNGCEQVLLLSSQEDKDSADLVILSDRRLQDAPSAPLAILRNAVFNGSWWGMSPSLEERDVGTVLLRSEQTGVGRHPWYQTLRIGWQEDAFRVQGFNYVSYDRITTSSYRCSLDYRSGEWITKATWVDPQSEEDKSAAESGTLDSPAPLLSDHSAFMDLPEPCQAVQTLFFDNLP